jgi:hypothetical protein
MYRRRTDGSGGKYGEGIFFKSWKILYRHVRSETTGHHGQRQRIVLAGISRLPVDRLPDACRSDKVRPCLCRGIGGCRLGCRGGRTTTCTGTTAMTCLACYNIEYLFHFTLIVVGFVLARYFWRSIVPPANGQKVA